MNFSFDGAYIMPGQLTERLTWENTFWFGDRALQQWTGVVLSGAARDTGNTSYTTILRSGLLLGRVTATNKIKEWNPTGTDGSEQIFGVLDLSVNTQRLGANQDRWLAYIMVGGTLKADRLIIPGNTTMGIDNETLEHLVRAQMYRRFIFSDDWDGNPHGGWKNVVVKTASYTVTEADNNVLFSTRGASGAVTFTLPATAKKGLRYGFYNAADQDMLVASGTADTMVAINDLAADSVAFSTSSLKIGGMFEVFGDGTGWLTRVSMGQSSNGTTSGQLVTVAS